MNQDQVKEQLLRLDEDVEEFFLIFSGKRSKKANGIYHPDTREIILHNRNFEDDTALMYTAIHEFAHHIHFTTSPVPVGPRAHTVEFRSILHQLLDNPKMIILDEATSSVDLYTEAKIQDSTDLLLTGRTSIVIAHRLTTILKSDKIVVLNEGEIAQIGTHDDLVSIEGPYKEMYDLYFKTQSAKYLEQIKVSR